MNGSATLPEPLTRPCADMPLAHAVGRLLDATVLPRHHLRQCANVWTQWAFRAIMHLARLYCCVRPAQASDGGKQGTPPPPCPRCHKRSAEHQNVGPFDWDDDSVGDLDDDDRDDDDLASVGDEAEDSSSSSRLATRTD